ncbi:Sigma 54 modulation protein / S30EA ribosomal protein [Planctomycetes bacterium Pan216]|uniref:Sigma 54 modulation protein / S30EA ribosomal protein n=1 Tax=Kolteria novifilia TaxID=2527975 RepID=A0A518B9J8_9BACT|nr:Sigma 54 modulation protein / S30EA ribosomal protein [Planctomycetes bacterium Pan216]
METTISARHGSIAPEDHEYIDKKIPKLVHLFDRLTSVQVTVDFQKSEPQLELLVSAEHKHDFVAREHHAHVTAAFDSAMSKMESQLRRYKEKIQDHHRGRPDQSGEVAGFAGGEEV